MDPEGFLVFLFSLRSASSRKKSNDKKIPGSASASGALRPEFLVPKTESTWTTTRKKLSVLGPRNSLAFGYKSPLHHWVLGDSSPRSLAIKNPMVRRGNSCSRKAGLLGTTTLGLDSGHSSSLACGPRLWRKEKMPSKPGGVPRVPIDWNRLPVISWIQRLINGFLVSSRTRIFDPRND